MDTDSQAAYYRDLDGLSFLAGWARAQAPVGREPSPAFVPAVWRFAEARRALTQSLAFVAPEQAERRNLIMVNPAEGNRYATTRNIVAAYQMIGPGERLPSHRHTPSAACLMVEVKPGAYTTVEGQRFDMADGDVVLTPNWRWHGHGNDGAEPGFWITFLDVPLLQHMEAMFFEPHPDRVEPIEGRAERSAFRIPARETLAASPDAGTIEIAHGAIPAMGLTLIQFKAGGARDIPRRTVNNLYSVIDGAARITAESGWAETLGPGDVAAMPSWRRHRIEAASDAILLRVSDEPLVTALGYLRSAPGSTPGSTPD